VPPLPIKIVPTDLQIFTNLRSPHGSEQYAMAEWEVLRNLEPIEQLLHNIAEGPNLDLHLDDEFPPVPGNPFIRTVDQNSHTYKLAQSTFHLDAVLGLIPLDQLSPRMQALCYVFLLTDKQDKDNQPLPKLDPAISKALGAAFAARTPKPQKQINLQTLQLLQNFTIDKQLAKKMHSYIVPYFNCLRAVLKHPDVKRAHSYRINRAQKHHQRLTSLFNATRKRHSKVLLIYMELIVPAPGVEDKEDPEGYKRLSTARSKLLKGRQDNALFYGLIGYAWKYRYTHDRGLACMMVLLFDCKAQPQRHSLSEALGEKWLAVAPKGSHCWLPSAAAGETTFLYHGYLDCKAKAVEEGFAALARVMGLYDAYVKPKAPKQLHVFDASKPPGTKPRPQKRQSKRRPVAKS